MPHLNDLHRKSRTDDGHSSSAPAALLQARLFIFSRGVSTPCTVAGITGSDLALACPYEGPPGTAVTILLENFGALTGIILGREKDILRLRCTIGDSWNMRLLQDLTHFISTNGKTRPMPDQGNLDSFPVDGDFLRANGERVKFELSRISAHDIRVKSPVQPPVGEFLNFGIFFARVTRRHEDGFKAQFLDNM